jgi:hypothetical protein
MASDEARRPAPFVVGVGRSGTTLLRLMLDSHPELAIPPETNFLPRVARLCRRAADPWACFVEDLSGRKRWPDFHVDAQALAERVVRIRPFDLGEALRCFYETYAQRFDKHRWGDKTPRYLEHMQAVSEALPEAHFVHVIRDGRDVALSHQGLWFGPESVREAAGWWREKVVAARSAGLTLPYLEIRYEDLVLETERTLRRVTDFVDLQWDAAMLAYHKRAAERVAELRADVTSKKGLVRVTAKERRQIFATTTKPPQPSRVGRWRRHLTGAEKRAFDREAGQLLESLGYDRGDF